MSKRQVSKFCIFVFLTLLSSTLMLSGTMVELSQITRTSGGGRQAHGFPATSADGTRIAFQSNRDLTPNNPGNPDEYFQIFLWDEGKGFRQITDTKEQLNLNCSLSADGSTIAFESTADLTPNDPGNPSGTFQVFTWREDTGFKQITNSTTGFNRVRGISADGTALAILSDADLTPNQPGNPDHVNQIYLWKEDRGFTQTTSGRFTYFVDGLSADGRVMALVSNADLTPNAPGNPDGNLQIFTWTEGQGFRQITASRQGANERPSISPDGATVVFRSRADLTPNNPGNPDGNAQIFLWREDTGFQQITAAAFPHGSDNPVVTDDGVVAFMSFADLTPDNPGNPQHNNELFVWTEDVGITQVTATEGGRNFARAISQDGARITFTSDEDLTGDNPGRDIQVFQAILTRKP